MLIQLIEEIKKSGTTSADTLAARLATTPEMVKAMLDTLEDQGYLKSMDPTCASEKPCDSCSLSNMCSTHTNEKPRVRIFQDKSRSSSEIFEGG